MILATLDLGDFEIFLDKLRTTPQEALDVAGESAIWAARFAHQLARRTTTHWSRRPEVKTEVDLTWGDMAVLTFEVEGSVWHWIDRGTKGPYPIRARRAPYLVFRTGYTPRTTPNKLVSSGRGGVATGPWVQKKEVMHPGIEARNWTVRIAERLDELWEAKFAKLLLIRWQDEDPVDPIREKRKYPHKERS